MGTESISVGGVNVAATEPRDQYRQKIARISLDCMVQYVGLLDAEGTVLEINRTALDAAGYTIADVEGRPLWTTYWWLVNDEVNQNLRDAIRRAAQGEFVRWDTEIYSGGGDRNIVIIDAVLSPVKDDDGRVVFICAEGRDITEKKAYEREIARQREELAQLDVLKTQFFANVSHEFRTPLTLMLGPLDDAIRDADEPLAVRQRERVEVARRNGLRLQKLVNALLDFSRVQAGRIRAHYQPTDLAMLTQELASNFRSLCESAGLALTIDTPPLAEPVYVDPEMWEKIVLNLLSNAFKFTVVGGIAVSLAASGGMAELAVRDTGIGIPEDDLPRVFERFHRVETTAGRTHEGTGIGLALVQELVNLHNGDVGVESVLGRGTTFTVHVPLGRDHVPRDRLDDTRLTSTAVHADAFVNEASRWLPDAEKTRAVEAPPEEEAASGSAQSLVLVVDDNADMREYLVRLLSQHYSVIAAQNGRDALDHARNHHPDLILTDVMMPHIDGIGLLNAVRADPDLRGTPVIMVSARAGEESRVEGLDAGADDYLVKPFSARELFARVRACLELNLIRRRATQAVQESEQLFRAFLRASSDMVYRMNADWSEMRQLSGKNIVADIEHPSQNWLRDYIPADDQAKVLEAIDAAIRTQSMFAGEHRVRHLDGTLGWAASRAIPLFDAQGKVIEWFGTATDITERRQREEQSHALLNELNHRVKNTLAVVQSIARQTLRSGDTPRQSSDALEGRLLALAKAHDVLTRAKWQGASFREVLGDSLAAYHGLGASGRINISGDDIRLKPFAVIAFAMGLHELATNALKYGALSPAGGLVGIVWRIDGGDLVFDWSESGGPHVIPPTRAGFGSRMIRSGLAHDLSANVELAFPAGGVTCSIRAPLSKIGALPEQGH
jgi:PAS domain S-box-containing protein